MRVKNYITITQFTQSPLSVQEFIRGWKKYYYPSEHELPDLRQCIEILIDVTRNFHKDANAPTRFYNNILENIDSVIAWDDDGAGSQLIDTLYYEIEVAIKHLLRVRGESM